MRLACAVALCLFYFAPSLAQQHQQQQQVDPAYLRQYYAQIQANQQHQSQQRSDVTPIHEGDGDFVPIQSPAQKARQFQVQRPAQPAIQQRQYSSSEHQQPQYHQPQQQYRPQKTRLSEEEQEEEEAYDSNPSYQFGFDVKDDEFTNYQNRKEVRDGGIIQGSYSVVDSDGFIRTVKYTAHPKEGFKAEVIREPTDIVIKMPEQVRAEQERANPGYHSKQGQSSSQGGASRYRLPNLPENIRQQYQQQ